MREALREAMRAAEEDEVPIGAVIVCKGRIIGKGTHEQLLASCAEYREISESQMGGAFVE